MGEALRLDREETTNGPSKSKKKRKKVSLFSQLECFYLHVLGYSCNIIILSKDDSREGKRICVNAKMQKGLPIICEEMELKKCDGGGGRWGVGA